MSNRVIICITGMPGSGKSIVTKAIADLLKAKVIAMGDVVRLEARKRRIKPDIKSMMTFAEELRKEMGKAAVAKLTLNYINPNEKYVIIDGVRSLDEVNVFKSSIPDAEVLIVAVHASPKTRFERLRKRGRKDDPKSWDEFLLRDYKELDFGIGNVIALADIMIVNEGIDKESLRRLTVESVRRILNHDTN